MGTYENDPRVRFNADGTATLPDPVGGGWQVLHDGDVWVGHHEQQGFLHDLTDARYRAEYDTCDKVLRHLLGPAQVTA